MSVYSIVSPMGVSVCDSAQEAFNTVYYWPFNYCEVFTVETLEEAHILTNQVYNARFRGRPMLFNEEPMMLPVSGTFRTIDPEAERLMPHLDESGTMPVLNLPTTSVINNPSNNIASVQSVTYQQPSPLIGSGAWSVTFFGGYFLENDLSRLFGTLDTQMYAHAMWWPKTQTASNWVMKEYADRFCCSFDLRDGDFQHPPELLEIGQIYIDSRVINGEMKISQNDIIQKLRGYGLI